HQCVSAIQPPTITAMPMSGAVDIGRVNKTGLPSLIVREPCNRYRNRATLQIAQIAGGISWRAGDRFCRARVKLCPAEMTADNIVALACGRTVQLDVRRRVKIGSSVIPLLPVLPYR